MKYTYLILFVLVFNLSRGATGYADSAQNCRGSSYIGIVIMPDLVGAKYSIIAPINKPRLSYSAGFNYNYIVGTHWGFHGGVLYADKGSSVESSTTFFDTYNGVVINGSYYVNIHDYYIDIPLGADYYFGKKACRFYFSGSIIPSFFINNTNIMKVSYHDTAFYPQNVTYHDNIAYRNIIVNASVGGGCLFPVNKKID